MFGQPAIIKATPSAIGYVIAGGGSNNVSPADAASVYFDSTGRAPSTTEALYRCYIPKAGTLKAAYVYWNGTGTAGSNESITLNFRLNATTDVAIAAIGDTNAIKVFSNTGLSQALAVGDFFAMKVTCPTWATNPTAVVLSFTVYIE